MRLCKTRRFSPRGCATSSRLDLAWPSQWRDRDLGVGGDRLGDAARHCRDQVGDGERRQHCQISGNQQGDPPIQPEIDEDVVE